MKGDCLRAAAIVFPDMVLQYVGHVPDVRCDVLPATWRHVANHPIIPDATTKILGCSAKHPW